MNSLQFREMMTGLRHGAHEAVELLIAEFGPHLRQVIRRRLDVRMRSKFDSADFLQMVWVSFFEEKQRAAAIGGPLELKRFLTTLAKYRVIEEFRKRLRSDKYNVRREQPLDETTCGVAGRHDSPSQWAVARERLQQLVRDQPPRMHRLLQLKLSGASNADIGLALGIHERTVRKLLQQLHAETDYAQPWLGLAPADPSAR